MRMRVWLGGLCSLLLCVVLSVLFSNAPHTRERSFSVHIQGRVLRPRFWLMRQGKYGKKLLGSGCRCIVGGWVTHSN
jgi:hypothetical protein